jgi:citrate synthase
MAEWMNREQALAALGVRPQTLYAYVSRGRIAMMPDPADPRRSLYLSEDIAALTTRRARGRAVTRIAASTIAWGEPSIVTAISTIRRGVLIYRGRDAVAWARSATLEETAALLWQSAEPIDFPVPARSIADPYRALAALVPASAPMLGRGADRLRQDAASVIGHIAASLGADAALPVHLRLAKAWGLDNLQADRIRQTLVLMADHELNASTFATRVAASTGASIAASLLAGLATLSGPRHGGAGAALIALLDEAERIGPAPAVAAWLARGQPIAAFGHPLYPQGDVRAIKLLDGLDVDPLALRLRDAVFDATGALPNIDFALAAITRAYRLPPTAPLALFTMGRSVGWAAHAMEQILSGDLIRPRARYEGPDPTPSPSLKGRG